MNVTKKEFTIKDIKMIEERHSENGKLKKVITYPKPIFKSSIPCKETTQKDIDDFKKANTLQEKVDIIAKILNLE